MRNPLNPEVVLGALILTAGLAVIIPSGFGFWKAMTEPRIVEGCYIHVTSPPYVQLVASIRWSVDETIVSGVTIEDAQKVMAATPYCNPKP